MIAFKILAVLVFCAFSEARRVALVHEERCQYTADEVDWLRIAEQRWFLVLKTKNAPEKLASVCTALGEANATSNEITFREYFLSNEVGIVETQTLTLQRQRPGVYRHAINQENLQSLGINSICELEDLPEDSSERRLFHNEFIVRTDYEKYLLITECNPTIDDTIGLIFLDRPMPSIAKVIPALNAWIYPSKSPLVVTDCQDLTLDPAELLYP